MTRVFIVENLPKLNLANLSHYGEITYLFSTQHDIMTKPNCWSMEFDEEVIDRLEQHSFNPERDYFAATGNMLIAQITIANLVSFYGEINCLLFDTRKKVFRGRVVGGVVQEV